MATSNRTATPSALTEAIEQLLQEQGWVETWLRTNLMLEGEGVEDGYPVAGLPYIFGNDPENPGYSDNINLRDLLIKALAETTVQVFQQASASYHSDMQTFLLALQEDGRGLQRGEKGGGLQEWMSGAMEQFTELWQAFIYMLVEMLSRTTTTISVERAPAMDDVEEGHLGAWMSNAARGVSSPMRATLEDSLGQRYMSDAFWTHASEILDSLPIDARARVMKELRSENVTQFTLKQVFVADFCQEWLGNEENLSAMQAAVNR